MNMEKLGLNLFTISLEINFRTTILTKHADRSVLTDMFQELSNVMMGMRSTGTDAAPPVCLKELQLAIQTR